MLFNKNFIQYTWILFLKLSYMNFKMKCVKNDYKLLLSNKK